MKIYKITSNDWKKFKEIRLDALKNESEAFAASFEEKTKSSNEEWINKLEDDKNFIYVADDGGNVCGMAGAYQEKGEKIKHLANLWSFYVKKEYRGKGIGGQLMQALLEEFRETGEIKKVKLYVNTKQLSAIKLYESFGFEIVGTLHNEMKIDGKFFDLYVMEKLF